MVDKQEMIRKYIAASYCMYYIQTELVCDGFWDD